MELNYEKILQFLNKLEKKILKEGKVLLVVIDIENKKFYNNKKLKESIESIKKEFNLKDENILIKNILDIPPELISKINETPAYLLFVKNKENKALDIDLYWYGEGYYKLKK